MNRPNAEGPGAGGAGTPDGELFPEPWLSRPSESGQATSEGAREQLREAKNRVMDQARGALDQARERATSTLSEGRLRAADQVGGIATAFRRTSEHLRGEDQARIAGLADSVGRQADQVASYLRDTDARAMTRDLERLARRQPAIVLGAAFALGLIGARFFKSSEPTEKADEYGGYDRIRAGGEPAGIGGGGIDDRI